MMALLILLLVIAGICISIAICPAAVIRVSILFELSFKLIYRIGRRVDHEFGLLVKRNHVCLRQQE